MERADAFIHFFELRGAQAFNARLHALHPALGEGLNLLLGQVGFGLHEHVQVIVTGGESTEQLVDVFQIDNVIDQPEARGVIATGEPVHFLGHLFGRLGAKRHGLRVQPTKRTMMFFAPPAPA